MNKTIFISRQQTAESPFRSMMKEQGFTVYGLSLIDIQAVTISEVPATEWLFFYSRNGVKHFFAQASPEQVKHKKIAAIGPGTAQSLRDIGQRVDFVGNGLPEGTSNAFAAIARGASVTFVQARNSRQSVQTLLGKTIEAHTLVAYDNQAKKDFQLPCCSVLAFTSSMNARAYFSVYVLHDWQKVIAIGEITAQALQVLGIKDVILAETPTEQGLAKAVSLAL